MHCRLREGPSFLVCLCILVIIYLRQLYLLVYFSGDVQITGRVLEPGVILYSEKAIDFDQAEAILIGPEVPAEELACSKLPIGYWKTNGTFMIDLSRLGSTDLTADGLGDWKQPQSRSRYYSEVDDETGMVQRGDVANRRPEKYELQQFRQNFVKETLSKSFYRLFSGGENLFKYALITYQWIGQDEPDQPMADEQRKNVTNEEAPPLLDREGRGEERMKMVRRGQLKATAQSRELADESGFLVSAAAQRFCEHHLTSRFREEMHRRAMAESDIDDVIGDLFGNSEDHKSGLLQQRTDLEFWNEAQTLKRKWAELDRKYADETPRVPLYDYLLGAVNVSASTGGSIVRGGLSIDFSETDIEGLQAEHLKECWQKAERILSSGPEAVTRDPSTEDVYFVRDPTDWQHRVLWNERTNLFMCDKFCADFRDRFGGLFCAHTLATAEAVGELDFCLEQVRMGTARKKGSPKKRQRSMLVNVSI